MTEQAQPQDEGQGDAGTTGLFDSYLQTVPQEHRQVVETYLQDAARNVNGRLEEAATLRNTYGQYAQVPGLDQYTPEDLGQLVAWHQNVASDPDALRAWLADASKEAGLTVQEQQQLQDAAEDMSLPDLNRFREEFEQQALAPLREQLAELQQSQFTEREGRLIAQRFTDLEKEHGVKLTDEQRDVIVDLGIAAMPGDDQSLLAGQDWIAAGFDRFRQINALAEKAFVDAKLDQPRPAVSSGGVAAQVQSNDWKEVAAQAMERLRQSRT